MESTQEIKARYEAGLKQKTQMQELKKRGYVCHIPAEEEIGQGATLEQRMQFRTLLRRGKPVAGANYLAQFENACRAEKL